MPYIAITKIKFILSINIGNGAKIGAGSVVLKDVPAGATCVGIPGRIVKQKREPALLLEHAKLPDPVADIIDLQKSYLIQKYGNELLQQKKVFATYSFDEE